MNALRLLIVAGSLLCGLASVGANGVKGVIQFQGDTVHLELSGQQNWDYDLKRLDKKGTTVVEMTVPALDEPTIQSMNAFKSDYVSSVSVDRKGPDGKHVISFTLASENIETFDYLTDQPSRLIMDFYINPSSITPTGETTSTNLPTKLPKKIVKGKTQQSRKPAADTLAIAPQGSIAAAVVPETVRSGLFDGGDPSYERFSIKDYEIKEESLVRARDNYYMSFPMLETPIGHWEKMKIAPTLYEITPQKTDENKQARLLWTLFEKGRYAVFLKTREWFKEKYPESEYGEMIDYMTADVHLALWRDESRAASYDHALQLYKEAIQKYPKSPLAERTSLKLGFLALEKNDSLDALRLFNEHVENKNFPDKPSLSKDLARLGMGVAYMKINRWNEADAQLADVEKNASNHDLQVEAAYRRGDVWMKAKDYPKAVQQYQTAQNAYPEGLSSYPNAYYNQAESLFGMKKYLQSLELYREFVKKFPAGNHGAFAMTRMGELLDIFGVDKSRVMGAYLETYFRYGENPSAVIARLRLLGIRMKGMKPKEVTHTVGEITSLAKKIDYLPKIKQFETVLVADGYRSREEYQKAIDLLSKYYKENPTSVDVSLITNRIVSNINDKLESEVKSGSFIKALKTHGQYADTWLKNSSRLDTKYNVGRAFELGGAPVEAEKYYQDVLNRVYAIRGTVEAKEIQITEEIPSEEELNLRLAAVSSQEQKFNEAYEYLRNIKSPEKLSDASQIERVNIAVRLLEKRGDNESAIRYLGELLRTWKGEPELVAEPYMKLSELQIKQGKLDEALRSLEMIDRLQTDSSKIAPVYHAYALEKAADIYLQKGDTEKAIQSYGKLLETYEDKRALSSVRYKLGQIHFERGEPQKAAEVWGEFKGEKNTFWKNLAQEQLKNSHWRDGYKKYIKRIPAMSENEQGK